MTPDPDMLGGNGDGLDLGVNRLLRSTVLNEDRALAVKIADGVIFEGRDMLTETLITLNEVRLLGLDSFGEFDPLNGVGRYTLGNRFFWKHLTVEMDLTLVMKPSTTSDSLIVVGTEAEVRETISLAMGINAIDVDFHFLLGVDEKELGSVQLSSVLNTAYILPCVLKSFFASEVTGFAASVGDIETPTLSGFISPGIDSLVSKAADAVFLMYEPTLMKAIPNFFELTVRNVTNQFLLSIVENNQTDSSCISWGESSSQDQYVHFGDMFLSREDAASMGGSGNAPYGTILTDVVSFIREEAKAVNPISGDLYLNEMIVRPFTGQQSGTPGTLLFSDLFQSNGTVTVGEFFATFELKLSDAQVENIDSFGLPLELLQPSAGTVLNNNFTIGAGDRPLRGSTLLTFAFEDGGE